ncbi:MAG: hypothetical protein GXP25_16905, partial [Planctomycetes bacterium]|nr:hypothetical protein [Planctomycetota bacterium]
AEQVRGWAPAAEPGVYEPENLFEYIDGAAETYLDYGFVICAAAEYRPTDGRKIGVNIDIYDMGAVDNAFGVYSNGAFADANYLDLGTEGYLTESSADFFKDRYYVKLTGYGKPKDVQQPVLALAKAVAANIKAVPKPPSGEAFMPKERRIPKTLKYFRNNALGQSFLKDAFQATYRLTQGDLTEQPQLLVARLDSPEKAAEAATRFKAFMVEAGKVLSEGTDRFLADDPYYKKVAVRVSGKYLLCVLKAPSEVAAGKLMDAAIANLGKR